MKYFIVVMLCVTMFIGCNSGETMTEEDVERLELLRDAKPSMNDDKAYNLFVFFEFYDGSLDPED